MGCVERVAEIYEGRKTRLRPCTARPFRRATWYIVVLCGRSEGNAAVNAGVSCVCGTMVDGGDVMVGEGIGRCLVC